MSKTINDIQVIVILFAKQHILFAMQWHRGILHNFIQQSLNLGYV